MNKILKKLLLLGCSASLGGCESTKNIKYFETGFFFGSLKVESYTCEISIGLKGPREQDSNAFLLVHIGHNYIFEEAWQNNIIETSDGVFFQKTENTKFALKRIIQDSENNDVDVKYTIYEDFPNFQKYSMHIVDSVKLKDSFKRSYQYTFIDSFDLSSINSNLTKGKITYSMVCYEVSTSEELDIYYTYNSETQKNRMFTFYFDDNYPRRIKPYEIPIDFEINDNKVNFLCYESYSGLISDIVSYKTY